MIHESYMRRALELAEFGKGAVAPNPMVGAVLVHDGRIIGEGWHKEYGKPHAEVNCIESVSPEDRTLIPQSTMYVTLEPCAHHGKTPPCAVRLVDEGIRSLVICNKDPFEKVNGSGIKILQEAGVAITAGILEAEGLWVNRRFFCAQTKQRPYVILKWAESADGFIAPEDRTRTQLSNKHSSRIVHKWRTEEQAILVGYNTALYDDPKLNARYWSGRQPLRVILDRNLQLPNDLHVFDRSQPTWIINQVKDVAAPELSYVQIPHDRSFIAMLLERLKTAGYHSLIVEGGARVLQQFIDTGLWDEARVFKTEISLGSGIRAPLLTGDLLAMDLPSGNDRLELFINENAGVQFSKGMNL